MKIKIPRYLSYTISGDRSLKRGMAIYLYLKAIDHSGRGVIKMDLKAKEEAAINLLCKSTRTIDAWLNEALKHKLIIKNEDAIYSTISWDKLCTRFNVLCTGYYHVPIGVVPIKDILDSKCMVEQRHRCATAARAKKNTPGVDLELYEVMQSKGLTSSDSDIKQLQHIDYISGGRVLTPEQRFAVFFANPDYNTGSHKYTKIFNTKNFFYKKQRLIAQGMIVAQSRQIEVPESCMPFMKTKEKRETLLGTLRYVRESKSLVLFLADHISFNNYDSWKSSFKSTSKSLQN